MILHRRTTAYKLSLLLATVMSVQPAIAQQSGAADTAPDRGESGLDRILVTAERREQDSQDVPISATILNKDELKKRGVNNINDLTQVAPSVVINTYNRQTFVNIRGIGVNRSAPTTASGVAYYVDGVVVPNDKFIGFSFYDIDAIEILRGPQGTLTGQNSTGGAIFVRTPTPVFNDVSAEMETTIGNYSYRRLEGAANFGMENVAIRLAAVHDERDSFTQNIGTSISQPGRYEMDSGRATVYMQGLDSKLNIFLRGEYFDSRSDGNAVKNRFDAVTSDPFIIEEDAVSFTNQEGHRLSAEARYDLNDSIQLRALVSDQNGVTYDQTDGDRTSTALPVPIGLPTNGANSAMFPGRVANVRTQINTFIAEVNLLSTGDGPFQWVLGGFYLDDEIDLESYRDNRSAVDFVSSNSTIDQTAFAESVSVFGQANYFVTEQLELLVGGRYSWDDQTLARSILTTNMFDPPRESVASSSEWTGKVAINYHLDDLLLYASASKGYKTGGTNLPPPAASFGPETNFVYELGFKSEILGRHLRINGNIFYSDYKDLQLASLSNNLPLTQNAAKAKSWGVELESLAQFGDTLFNIGVGYLNAEFAEDACLNDTNSSVMSVECSPGNRLVPDGDRIPYAPKWTVNIGVQHDFLVSGDLTITPRVQWSHVGDQIASPFSSIYTVMPSRDVLDARLTFHVRDRYQLEAFVQNFTDETYISTQVQDASSSDGGYIFGAPLTWGVRLSAEFGGR